MQEWRNWQTRRLQVPVVARSCGFKSHLLHYFENFCVSKFFQWTNSDYPDFKWKLSVRSIYEFSVLTVLDDGAGLLADLAVRWTNSDCPDGKCENFPSGYLYFSRKENNSDRTFYAQYTLQKYSRKEISVIRQK